MLQGGSQKAAGSAAPALQVLRWIYGALVCTQNLEFLDRQADVSASHP